MKRPPIPEVGDIWVKHAYKTVGWPAGRVTITDVVKLTKESRVHYNYLSGPELGKPKQLELHAFQRMFLYVRSHSPEVLPDPDALPFAEHTEAYRGEDEI